ncbi:Rhamnogalacturonan acetylesterase RhgT [compost metagenome]
MRAVAELTGTPLLDIFAASQQLYRVLGYEGSQHLFMHLPPGQHPNYPDGVTDDTHFSTEGAKRIAELVAVAIRESSALSGLHPFLHLNANT